LVALWEVDVLLFAFIN